jgi:hypothetical protein
MFEKAENSLCGYRNASRSTKMRFLEGTACKETYAGSGDVIWAQLASEYNRADVSSLPSVQEGFGIVSLKAMAPGKPIIAARATPSRGLSATGR